MELHQIYELLERFENSSLSEMNLELHGARLFLKRREDGAQSGTSCGSAAGAAASLSSGAVSDAQTAKSATAAKDAAPEKGDAALRTPDSGKEIKAPLIGTFYLAPSPDEEPYVKVGQQVKKGDVIGIIEAMKLMNEVTAQEDGTVTEILAQDGTLVEFGQALIRLQ